jgi:hypothetical protein
MSDFLWEFPGWLEKSGTWNAGSQVYLGRGIELVVDANLDPGWEHRFALCRNVQGESAEDHFNTNSWEHALDYLTRHGLLRA